MSVPDERSRFGDGKALAARLKHRVTIQQRVRSSDGAGGSEVSWSNVVTVWAEFRSRSRGGERQEAGKLEASMALEMVMRYRGDVTADMRVLHDSTAYNIRRVINVDAANVMLELLLEAGVED